MKVVEILKLGEKIIQTLHEACIKMDDVKYIGMYEEYMKLREGGAKASAAVYILAGKYGLSERKVWYLIKRFGKECKILAAG